MQASSTLIWRLMPTDVNYPTAYVLQVRQPSPGDVERLTALGWEAASLERSGSHYSHLFVTNDVDIALSSGVSETEWLDSAAIAVE